MAKEKPAVRLRSSGSDYDHGAKKIEIGGLNEEESEQMNGVLNGHYWATVRDGRLVFEPTRQPLPAPTEDAEILPYWQGQGQMRFVQLDKERAEGAFAPQIIIQFLCGYHWSKENYKNQANKLESYGFSCLRSRRGKDGRFWEVWYLPGLFLAKGELQKALAERNDDEKKIDMAVRFLCQHCSFGSLEVSVQRAAMVLD